MSGAQASQESTGVRSPEHPDRPWDYVIIAGNGGSGSKRLLHLLDQSPRTHCRNEPYNNLTSPFRAIREFPRGWAIPPGEERLLEEGWDAAVAWSAARQGDRDFLPPPRKHHLHEAVRAAGLLKPLASRTLRRWMGLLTPALGQEEWELPRWAGSRERLSGAIPVLKFNQSSGLIAWVLANRPRVKVVHIVRHPAGCLNSWRKRHLAQHPTDFVFENNRERLRSVAAIDPEAARQFGDIESLSLEASELVFWRYAALAIHRAVPDPGQYELVLDEDVVADGPDVARRIYDACGIPFEEPVEAYVRDHAENWAKKSCPWKTMIPETDHALVEGLLEDTEMADWWNPEQVVSRIDYTWQT